MSTIAQRRTLGLPTPGPISIHDAATAAVKHKGTGVAVGESVRAPIEAHLGVDLSRARTHDDALSQHATAAMCARAFAYGNDVFLGPGESASDPGLMAHELTHVAQQSEHGARQPQRQVQVGDASSPAETQADGVAAAVTAGNAPPAVLLVDEPPVGPGQMLKSQFAEQLRSAVTAAADAELGPVYSAIGCPYIDLYFRRYGGRPASEVLALLNRFAPATRASKQASDMIPAVVARVQVGVRQWRDTGQTPPELGADAPVAPSTAAAAPATAQALRAPDGSDTLASLEAEIGPGAPLDGTTASRMSSALDTDVSSVRIHTDGVAARKASEANAAAVTVGNHLLFGAGRYEPGIPAGDALLAHELTHVDQQHEAASDPVARRRPVGDESAGAEVAADEATVGALARLWGGAKGVTRRAQAALRTDVQMQRCTTPSAAPSGPTPFTPTGSAASGNPDFMTGTAPVTDGQHKDIDKILNPAGGGGSGALAFVGANFEADLVNALNGWRSRITRSNKKLKGPDALKLDMPQVRKTGEAAQQVVTSHYGSYVQAGSFNADTNARKPGYDVGSPAVLHPQEDSIDPLPAADQDAIVIGLVEYATVQTDGGQPVLDSHHVDRSRGPDRAAYDKVVQDYAKAHRAELTEIQRMWPGEEHPWDGTVYIQLRRMKDPDLSKKETAKASGFEDANFRAGYWSTFQTLIHEYLHACAHANLQAAANTNRGLTHQILIEGGCDFYTEKIWNDIFPAKISSDDALREKVEGKKYPYNADVIPAPSYYDDKEKVKDLIAKLGGAGEANFAAAYFMGHTELIGLGAWKPSLEKDADTFIAPVADFKLAWVAERCWVGEDKVASGNSLSVGDKVAAGTRLKVPGIRHHSALKEDTKPDIAKQHGVTEAALTTANPALTWTFAGGEDVLIPVH